MSGPSGGTEKITLEDVVFRYMLDLSQTASKIRTSTDLEYQKNADNYYYQVLALWGILGDYIDPATERKRLEILHRAKVKYLSLKNSQIGGKTLIKGRKDEVVSITMNAANQTLKIMSICLSKKGILKERSGSAVAGTRHIEENQDMEKEFNAPDPLEAVAGAQGKK